jgi:uncharacterized protein
MNLDSRLDRLAALKAPRRAESAQEPSPSRRGIEELLQGLVRQTEFGTHVVAEGREPGHNPPVAGRYALTRVAGNVPVEALDPANWLLLDTETTGLSGGTGTWAFLVGVAKWQAGTLAVRQYFMRDPTEERSMLHELREELRESPVLVTFNGKSFDWPLLETRYRMMRLGQAPVPLLHLDLLHPSRQPWKMRLASTSLSELERRVLALQRGADIPSETIPQRYFDYLRGGAPEPVAEVFHHNRLDLAGLALLTCRVLHLLEEPETRISEPCELFGASRILHRNGETGLAARLYETALALGLPEEAARTARRELALFAKRSGDYDRANLFWEELRGDSPTGIRACEELAIHFEHRSHDDARAAGFTRDAIVRLREAAVAGRVSADRYRRLHEELQHRLKRLTSKLPG